MHFLLKSLTVEIKQAETIKMAMSKPKLVKRGPTKAL